MSQSEARAEANLTQNGKGGGVSLNSLRAAGTPRVRTKNALSQSKPKASDAGTLGALTGEVGDLRAGHGTCDGLLGIVSLALMFVVQPLRRGPKHDVWDFCRMVKR